MTLVSEWSALRDQIVAESSASGKIVSPDVHAEDMLWRFVLGYPAFAGPEDAVRYYFSDGAESATKLRAIVDAAWPSGSGLSLLEFASGYGMVTRHLRNALPNATIISCDIHQPAVDFIQGHLGVPALMSTHAPEDCSFGRTFDVVFALSFFSHMPEATFGSWLTALFRAVAPGGLLIFTTHGLSSAAALGNPEIPATGHWFKPDSEQFDLDGAAYGSALTTTEYVIRQLFRATGAPLMDFKAGYWWGHQDLYVVSRPAVSGDNRVPASHSSPLADRDARSLENLERRIDGLAGKISQVRASVIKAYENTPRAATEVLAARRGASYREAYTARPLVTVRIGAYAGGDSLFERALSSVQRQSYSHWEAIIVCDGRDEQTAARIASLGDSRIRCVQRPRNGPYPLDAHAHWQVAGVHPFNEGMALARGAWIAPIDQDDEWTTDHLDVLLAAALQSEAEVVYGVGQVVIPDEGETYFGVWPPVLGDFGFQAAIYHADLTAFLYDLNAYLADEPADWNLARRMLEAGVRFEFVERIVTTYHVEGERSGMESWRERIRQRGPFVAE